MGLGRLRNKTVKVTATDSSVKSTNNIFEAGKIEDGLLQYVRKLRSFEAPNLEPTKVEKPSNIPTAPKLPYNIFIFPLVIIAAGVFVSSILSNMVFMLIFMSVGVLTGLIQYLVSVREYKAECDKYKENMAHKYEIAVNVFSERLGSYKKYIGDCYPPTETLFNSILVYDKVWRRFSNDMDYLTLRLGVETKKYPFAMRLDGVWLRGDRNEYNLRAEKLGVNYAEFADNLVDSLDNIGEQPVFLPIRKKTITFYNPSISHLSLLAYTHIFQLCAMHSPKNVRLIVIDDNAPGCLRVLPHTTSYDNSGVLVAASLDDEIKYVYKALKESPYEDVVVVAIDSKKALQSSLSELWRVDNPDRGTLLYYSSDKTAPLDCNYEVHVDFSTKSGILVGLSDYTLDDLISYEKLFIACHMLGGIELHEESGVTNDTPAMVKFYDLPEYRNNFSEEAVSRLRVSCDASSSLNVEIGISSSAVAVELDICSGKDGPHGLVAGTTGSGKSEFLKTIVMAHCIKYSPNDFQFAIIDFKGGETADKLLSFPHYAGEFRNARGNPKYSSERIISMLNSEITRREELKSEASQKYSLGSEFSEYVSKINHNRDDYPDIEPLAHLLIIVDECAELLSVNSEFESNLIKIARTGRSLGMHLLLALQNPTGVITQQIRANLSYYICFRVETEDGSKDVLHSGFAANIPKTIPGRGYVFGGRYTIATLFQAACGSTRVTAVRDDDKVLSILCKPYSIDVSVQEDTSAKREYEYLSELLNRLDEKSKHILLNALPNECPINLSSLNCNDLNIEVGLADRIVDQRQDGFILPLDKANTVIFGKSQSGKTTLLTNILLSLCYYNTPTNVGVYVVGRFKEYMYLRGLPHILGIGSYSDSISWYRVIKAVESEIERRSENRDYSGKIVVFIDDLSEFCALGNPTDSSLLYGGNTLWVYDLIRRGPSVGVTFVVSTSDTKIETLSRVQTCFGNFIVFETGSSAHEYPQILGGGLIIKEPAQVLGRSLMKSIVERTAVEVQVYSLKEASKSQELCKNIQRKYDKSHLPDAVILPLEPIACNGYEIGKRCKVDYYQQLFPIGFDYLTNRVVGVPWDAGILMGVFIMPTIRYGFLRCALNQILNIQKHGLPPRTNVYILADNTAWCNGLGIDEDSVFDLSNSENSLIRLSGFVNTIINDKNRVILFFSSAAFAAWQPVTAKQSEISEVCKPFSTWVQSEVAKRFIFDTNMKTTFTDKFNNPVVKANADKASLLFDSTATVTWYNNFANAGLTTPILNSGCCLFRQYGEQNIVRLATEG